MTIPTMTKLAFTKMSGTGNDFIMIDNRSGIFSGKEQAFFSGICRRRLSIGADGVVLVENGDSAPVRMRYYNSDGMEASFCGNAGRCTAYYALEKGLVGSPDFHLEASDGTHAVAVRGHDVTVEIVRAADFRSGFDICREPEFIEGGYLNTGVPHFVIFVPDAGRIDVRSIAPFYRHHAAFPDGANVNFVQLNDSGRIRVRTYERGVEDETLSCGTGCVAAALIASKSRGYSSPVVVDTLGGRLTVTFDEHWERIFLSGPVEIIYEGLLYK